MEAPSAPIRIDAALVAASGRAPDRDVPGQPRNVWFATLI
jgi:hypothetical protein